VTGKRQGLMADGVNKKGGDANFDGVRTSSAWEGVKSILLSKNKERTKNGWV